MNDLLLVIAIALPCWYGYARSVSRGKIEINHVTTFTFGFLFYWITPLLVRLWAPRVDFPMASIWSALFRARFIMPYAISCIALYVCFMLGDSLGIRLFPAREGGPGAKVPKAMLSMVTAAGCALMAYSAYVERGDMFRTASPTDLRVDVARGAVTACVVLLGTVALMFTIDRPEIAWRRRFLSRYYLPFIAGGALLVLLGSRLYVASFLVMFAAYQTNLRAKFRLKAVVAALLLFGFLFGAVGTWREGSDVSGAYFNVFLEPMEGSLSLVHHLRFKGIAWINAPTQLMSDFENLVPTVLMPDKFKMLKKANAYHPLGGLHSFVSFNLNFGLVGTALFWFLLPVGFRFLRSRLTETLPATIYIMCTGWLTFTFFRDAFSISLVKAIFEDSIIIPVLIVAFGRLLTAACTRPEVFEQNAFQPEAS